MNTIKLSLGPFLIKDIPTIDSFSESTAGTYDKFLFTDDLLDDTITFTVENLTPSKIFRACGLSNNWLKMHGYPMIRRRAFFKQR